MKVSLFLSAKHNAGDHGNLLGSPIANYREGRGSPQDRRGRQAGDLAAKWLAHDKPGGSR